MAGISFGEDRYAAELRDKCFKAHAAAFPQHPVVEPVGEKHVVNPDHYARLKMDPIKFIMDNNFEFWRGSIIKYASRAGSKVYDGMTVVDSEITDLRKAIRFAEFRIEELQKEVKK